MIVKIRESDERDEKGIKALFSLCFGRELTHEEWSWKYLLSPWGSAGAVAVDDESVIAHYGGVGMRFQFEGRLLSAFQPCDVMTDPKYRARIFSRRGAMVRAGECFYESNAMDFAFGFPNERHAILGTKQLGYTEHGYVTVLNKTVSGFPRVLNPFLKVETGWDSVTEGELDALLEEAKGGLAFGIDKDSRYIFWRYRDNPVKEYLPINVRARFSGRLAAFAVCSLIKPDMSVLDLFTAGNFKVKSLLEYLEDIARRSGLDRVRVWVHPAEDIFGVLLKGGYAREKGVPLIFKILNKQITGSFLFSNYRYRMGDYDAS